MDLRTYIDINGWPAAEKLAEKVGTNRAYFAQLANGHRRPSVELALKIVKASRNEIDFMTLVTAKTKPRKRK